MVSGSTIMMRNKLSTPCTYVRIGVLGQGSMRHAIETGYLSRCDTSDLVVDPIDHKHTYINPSLEDIQGE